MDFFRNLLSSLIIFLLIPLLLAATLGFVVKRTVLSEAYLKQQAVASNIYAGAADYAAQNVSSNAPDNALNKAITSALTPQEIQHVVESGLHSVFQWLGSGGNLSVVIDLKDIKAKVRPSVPAAQQAQFNQQFPDQIDLAKLGQENGQTTGTNNPLPTIQHWYARANLGAQYSWLLVLGLLLLLALVNHGKSRLRRPAYVFMVDGLILAVIGGVADVGLPRVLARIGTNTNLPSVFQNSLTTLAKSIGGDMAREILIVGIIYVAVAVGLFIVSIFLPQPTEPAPAARES